MIKIEGLTKAYTKENVLQDLNCTIPDNCIYGLVGANGSGKSTLLRIISGVFDSDQGYITIDDKKIKDNEELKQKIVFIPDDLFFYPGYSLLDIAKFYQALYHNFDMNYLLQLAKILKLDPKAKIGTFSKGMKRQCALICAFATNADYLFFDETFDGLDPVVRSLVKKIIIKQMENKKTTIILTSHNLRELEDICDNLALLYDGGILFESEIATLKTNMYKIQISLKEDFNEETFKDFKILNFKKSGSVATIIISDATEKSKEKLKKLNPVILDFIPLTLEEVFIYEMGALGYEFNEVI